MNHPTLKPARVRVPCSASNLGAGFDCLGLALRLHLEVEFAPRADGEWRVERAGTLAELRTPAADDAVVRALRDTLAARGVPGGGTLKMRSAIPVARGLGSSAAATVAGLLLGAASLGETPDRAALLARATDIEGHPDNAAPALFGGLVGIATSGPGAPRAFRLPLADRLRFVYAAPPVEVSTAYARSVLPDTVRHNTAVSALSRVAALLHGLATADVALLQAGFEDELHVPWRLPLIPGANTAMQSAREAGAIAVTISGSGSGLIAVMEPGIEAEVGAAMKAAFEREGQQPAIAFPLEPDLAGAVILE